MRYGITVTKRVGNAVVRNRIKRRFRELLRAALHEHGLTDHDHVLIARDGAIERKFARMRDELAEALTRAAQGRTDRSEEHTSDIQARMSTSLDVFCFKTQKKTNS